jgi:hypothetical protein
MLNSNRMPTFVFDLDSGLIDRVRTAARKQIAADNTP